MLRHRNGYTTNVIIAPKFDEFILFVKNIMTTSGFFVGEGYVELTPSIIKKLDSGDLIITEYHDTPLGEIIFLAADSRLN